MIELNEKTQQDFLNSEWVKKLLDAGVDMSDAKYFLAWDYMIGKYYVFYGNPRDIFDRYRMYLLGDPPIGQKYNKPTYTISELLCILPKRLSIKLQNEEVIEAELTQRWDLFNSKYITGYFFSEVPINCMKILRSENSPLALGLYDSEFQMFSDCRAYDIEVESKCLIESLASLLIQCHQKNIDMKTKDTNNINNK